MSEIHDLAQQLRESIDATRASLNELLHEIDRRSRRRSYGVLAVVLMLGSFVGYETWSRHSDSIAACRQANETRALVREMTRDASTAAGEALIEVAAGADEETVTLYRHTLSRRLDEVVNQLGNRDC